MQYSEWDMKMMALGEIGAQLMSVLLAVTTWFYLGETSVFLKAPACLVVLAVVAKLSLGFIHLGYKPEEQREEA